MSRLFDFDLRILDYNLNTRYSTIAVSCVKCELWIRLKPIRNMFEIGVDKLLQHNMKIYIEKFI